MPSQQLAPVVLLGSLPPVGPESFLPTPTLQHPPLHLLVIFSFANLCGRAPLHLAGQLDHLSLSWLVRHFTHSPICWSFVPLLVCKSSLLVAVRHRGMLLTL